MGMQFNSPDYHKPGLLDTIRVYKKKHPKKYKWFIRTAKIVVIGIAVYYVLPFFLTLPTRLFSPAPQQQLEQRINIAGAQVIGENTLQFVVTTPEDLSKLVIQIEYFNGDSDTVILTEYAEFPNVSAGQTILTLNTNPEVNLYNNATRLTVI